MAYDDRETHGQDDSLSYREYAISSRGKWKDLMGKSSRENFWELAEEIVELRGAIAKGTSRTSYHERSLIFPSCTHLTSFLQIRSES